LLQPCSFITSLLSLLLLLKAGWGWEKGELEETKMDFTLFSPLLLSPAIVNFKGIHAKSGSNYAGEFGQKLIGMPGRG
jgi:hypothetical protein